MRYPLFVDLADRRVLVVGGGAVAQRRLSDLLAAGAVVTVVAPTVTPEIAQEAVTTLRRTFRASDIDGAWLVLACTNDSGVNEHVAAAADAAGVWCIRADSASSSSAWRPATTQVDQIMVAVTSAADPLRSVALRNEIEVRLRSGELTARRHRPGAGRVVLVGGGPGDPDLLTLRGFRALIDADVVVADRLGPTGLLDGLPPEVEVIDVGKNPRGDATDQPTINELLVSRAKRGETVVRLKGGDPFVLGRGSEEVDACLAAGVDVEVVPGLTSAVAASTLAGIPLTERGTTQHFTVVSGHVPPGDPRSSVDWAQLAASDATLVLLMAVTNLGPIAAALVTGGRKPDTGAAIVENASLPQQRIIRSTLGLIAAEALAHEIVPPAVVIVGEVVRG
jgi:uroporphyrin-III C-methyltransferase / precorrin-2 dehydrogenase / sirohydrochlorin ferrochelatase